MPFQKKVVTSHLLASNIWKDLLIIINVIGLPLDSGQDIRREPNKHWKLLRSRTGVLCSGKAGVAR